MIAIPLQELSELPLGWPACFLTGGTLARAPEHVEHMRLSVCLFGWKQEGLGVPLKLFERDLHQNPGARMGVNGNAQMQT